MDNLHYDTYQLTSLLKQADNAACSYFTYYKEII